MQVIYLHSYILRVFGGISYPYKPYLLSDPKPYISTTPATTGLGLSGIRPRSTGPGICTLQQYANLIVGPMAFVTRYIKTLISQLIRLVMSCGTNAICPRTMDQPGQGAYHPPFGGRVEGNVLVAPQKIVTKILNKIPNDIISLYSQIERRVLEGIGRGDLLLPGCGGNTSPRYLHELSLMN